MAKEEKKEVEVKIVSCAYCGRRVHVSEAKTFMDISKDAVPKYFCSPEHAIAHLFGIIRKFDEFILGLENAR